ncbi:MAG: hypothetical protein DBX47_01485 [Clostridiales bacterium]|nr:MAG: hypothetical protein DBX47_01485 [Clostridiales bacterium]
MDEVLTILIVEDDQDACKRLIEHAEETDEISVVGVTNNEDKAIEYIKDMLPQVVILDLELTEGKGNGLSVLQNLKSIDLSFQPYVLVTTNNTSPITYEFARKSGADFIMSKHQDGYSEKAVIDFLHMMKTVIQNKKNSTVQKNVVTESPEYKRKRILRRITAELNAVGINMKSVGYGYLVDAIYLALTQDSRNTASVIGEKYGKTESSVIRGMQNAINRAWRQSDIDELLIHYTARINSDRGVPTITEFIYYYANKLKNEY